MVTIFTPTYNRAYILDKLYHSLCAQTLKHFEWLIVDDGSSDHTCDLVASWIEVAPFSIRYIRQDNGGKHRAINRGVQEARGEIFFIVDSDDHLHPEAISKIEVSYRTIEGQPGVAGVTFMRVYPDGKRIGGDTTFTPQILRLTDFRCRLGIGGDLAETVYLSVMRKFPFPEVDGERFCPEAYLWHSIDRHYKMLYVNDGIYIAEYLPDGLTAKIKKLLMANPISATLAYSAMVRGTGKPLWFRLKNSMSYWRYYFHSRFQAHSSPLPRSILSVVAIPFGVLLYIKDKLLR